MIGKRDVDAESRNPRREGLVVLDAVIDGLQENRSAADSGLHVLREDELSVASVLTLPRFWGPWLVVW